MPLLIENYRFGRAVVDGVEYVTDLIVLPDRVLPNWWRLDGHRLEPEDLQDVVASRPPVLIIGTGAYGVMAVPSATINYLNEKGVRAEILSTVKAVARYNELARAHAVVAAALHLTC